MKSGQKWVQLPVLICMECLQLVTQKTVTTAEIKQAKALRDRIAEQMWTQYSQFKRQNRLR